MPGSTAGGSRASRRDRVKQLRRGAQPTPEGGASEDIFPFGASYRYSSNATGPLGGGGYTHLGDPNDEYSVNLTSEITLDSTNFDRQNMPTAEQGFNIPFARTFLFGNITKDWNYQIGTQAFLGTFNLLDMWATFKVADWLTVRFGKGLAPPLYEYYAFTPALEPVITNSPLFQLAAGRPIGVMFSGTLWKNRIQYWSGINNQAKSGYFALNRNMEFDGAWDVTPFKGTGGILEGLGGGFGISAGWQNYLLQQTSINWIQNGEASTNDSFITSSGVPFFVYKPGMRARANASALTPHIYWYGRLSFLAEYMLHSRELSDGITSGRSTQRGYYLNLSYYLDRRTRFPGQRISGLLDDPASAAVHPQPRRVGPRCLAGCGAVLGAQCGYRRLRPRLRGPGAVGQPPGPAHGRIELVAQQVHAAQLRLGLDRVQQAHPRQHAGTHLDVPDFLVPLRNVLLIRYRMRAVTARQSRPDRATTRTSSLANPG